MFAVSISCLVSSLRFSSITISLNLNNVVDTIFDNTSSSVLTLISCLLQLSSLYGEERRLAANSTIRGFSLYVKYCSLGNIPSSRALSNISNTSLCTSFLKRRSSFFRSSIMNEATLILNTAGLLFSSKPSMSISLSPYISSSFTNSCS